MSDATYKVALSRAANSFYDPESGCNLFKSSPVFAFNHPPTADIKSAVKGGRLVDVNGNIFDAKLEKEKLDQAIANRELKSKSASQTDEDLAKKEAEAVEKVTKAAAKKKDTADVEVTEAEKPSKKK